MKKILHSIRAVATRTESRDGDVERRNIDTPVWLCSFLRAYTIHPLGAAAWKADTQAN
jgi:hypothetical protein